MEHMAVWDSYGSFGPYVPLWIPCILWTPIHPIKPYGPYKPLWTLWTLCTLLEPYSPIDPYTHLWTDMDPRDPS